MSSEDLYQQHNSSHVHEEGEEGEPWLVSYADMMTLLFGFFVIMYTFASAKLEDDSEQWIRVKKELAAFFGGEKSEDNGDQGRGDSNDLFSPNVGIEVGSQSGSKRESQGIFDQARSDVESDGTDIKKYILGGTYVSPGSDLADSEIQSVLDLKKLVDSEKSLELIISNASLFSNDSTAISEKGLSILKNICKKLDTIRFPYFLGVTSFSQSAAKPRTLKAVASTAQISPPSLLTFQRSHLLISNFDECTKTQKNHPKLSAMGVGYVPRIGNLNGILTEGVIIRIGILVE